MKSFKLLVCLSVAALLSSCLDCEEKIIINSDDSGMYTMELDLGAMFKFEASLGGKPDYGRLPRKLDSTIYLENYVDTALNLSVEERDIYREGVICIKVDADKNDVKVFVSCPFKNIDDLAAIKTHFFGVVEKIQRVDQGDLLKQINPLAAQFTFLAKAGTISNCITSMEIYKKTIAPELAFSTLTPHAKLIGGLNYRTIFVLAKPIRQYNGPGSILSADKKTITFETNYYEMLEYPEKVSYTITY
jgi:hypothetical protein